MIEQNEETIVAIATAHGVGSISIVRLSGPNSLDIAKQISKKTDLKPRYTTLSKLYDKSNDLIDEALVIYFKAPYSFTGEDVIEFQCHGGIAISNMVLNECIEHGARIANPGEFSKRAYFNGKIDLSQAEAIAKLIESRSEDGVKLLARQLDGELKSFVDGIKENLLFMLAYSEVNIDYAEEDLPEDIYIQIQNKLDNIKIQLNTTLEASKRREGLIDGFKVAIIGKPNVGKSSLLNALLNKQRAIVSDIAGTTRDTIEESVKIGTHVIKIVDTAGIRDANDEIEKIGIERSVEAVKDADIIIAIFDSSRAYEKEDEEIINLLNSHIDKHILTILNKCDLTRQFTLEDDLLKNSINLNTKQSIEKLIKTMTNILDQNKHSDDVTLISTRQVKCVKDTLSEIEKAYIPLQSGELEFFSHHITEALEMISTITKPYEHSQMLDKMFGEFCLGK